MSMPEWDIFKRVEKLEKLKLEELKPAVAEMKPTSNDAFILATFAFLLGFSAIARGQRNPRQFKDRWLAELKKVRLSKKAYEVIEDWLLAICKVIEEG